MTKSTINDALEMGYFIAFALAALVMLILALFHTYEVGSDLCTKKRKSIKHRVAKPELKRSYKVLQYLTLITILLFAFYVALMVPIVADLPSGTQCIRWTIAASCCFLLGKSGMYIIFMYRLDLAYKQSAYGYSRRFISVMVALNMFYGVLAPVLICYALYHASYNIDDDEFPNPCFPRLEGNVVIAPAVILLWDFIMNILSLCLFVIPLRKTFKQMGFSITLSDDQKMNKFSGKMLYLAVKYSILTSVAAVTTIVAMLFLLVITSLAYLQAFDVAVNSVCLMFMTAYYPDDRYYQRMCACCLYVFCPKKFKRYSSNASKGAELRKTNDPSTKDTTQVYQQAQELAKRPSRTNTGIQSGNVEIQTAITDHEPEIEIEIARTVTLEVDAQKMEITPAPPHPQAPSKSNSSADEEEMP